MNVLGPVRSTTEKMVHPVTYGLCVHVVYLLAADSLVPPQPTFTCLGEVASPCGEVALVSVSCHLRRPQD